jgi:hypothetical protein
MGPEAWRRCEVEGAVMGVAARRVVLGEGRVCRVQLRKAGPAVEGAGRIVWVERAQVGVGGKMGA